jgi:GATA-binding protein
VRPVTLPQMSGAAPPQYEERGGLLQRAHHVSNNTMFVNEEPRSNPTSSSSTSITEHDYRFPRRPAVDKPSAARAPQTGVTSANKRDVSNLGNGKLDFSVSNSARKELLRESFFSTWKDDAGGADLDSPDEMQKKDPLATQIWKLYSKTKNQLPNQERMENLTWRMMAMSLRKRRQEEAARYGTRGVR